MSSEKVSTLVVEVDLRCEKCYKKVQKALCKLQQKENIRKIEYDNTKNTITISGAFNPHCLSKKLRCKVCGIIDIKIIQQPQPEPARKEDADAVIVIVVKPKDEEPPKPTPAPAVPPSSSSTATATATAAVNIHFTNVCGICYPWPCNNPAHRCGVQPQQQPPQQQQQQSQQKQQQQQQQPQQHQQAPEVKAKDDGAKATASSAATVDIHFKNMCTICYPWPCCDPTHGRCGVQPQPPPQPPPHHRHPPCCGTAPKCSPPCGGSSCYQGGRCRCCTGPCSSMHGCSVVPPPPPPPPPPPMCCPGPLACRGCNGCRIVCEQKFSYEDYPPPGPCAIM